MNLAYLVMAVAIGMFFSLQPSINAASVKALGTPVAAAVVSVAVTLAVLVALLPLYGGTVRPQALVNLPWWVIFGGLSGAALVAGGAAIAPVTGAAVFFVCLIAGQMAGSALVDQFGAFGMAVRELTWTKGAGLAMVLGGVLLVRAG